MTGPGERASRLPALDGLRGVLATTVVIDHALMELGSEAFGLAASSAVVVFFVMSGLVLTRSWPGNFGLFLARRFVRLWPVFALSLAAAGLLAWRVPAVFEFIWLPFPRYDANVLCPPMWSIFLEAWMALLMPAVVWSAAGGRWRTLGSTILCVGLAAYLRPERLELRALLSYSVCFVAGAGLSGISWHSALLEKPALQWLGRISYSLYLTHWLVLRAATEAFGQAGTMVGVLASFAVAEIVWRYVENPSIQLSRRITFAK